MWIIFLLVTEQVDNDDDDDEMSFQMKHLF